MLLNNWILACRAEYNVLKFLSCCLRPHILKQAALSLNKSLDEKPECCLYGFEDVPEFLDCESIIRG